MVIGGYTLVECLGRGGMGETWLAERASFAGVSQRVVLKRVLPAFVCDPALSEAFVQEARISAALNHGNIVKALDFGHHEGELYLAMEYVEGRTLRQVLNCAGRRLPVDVAVHVMTGVLAALDHAHSRRDAHGQPLNLVHRDVSPDNVLIGFDGEVKLIDFGIAMSDLPGRPETAHGIVKGKARYMSPEQVAGGAVDGRSDVYSAGIILYELLTGARPFEGRAMQVMRKIYDGDFVPVRDRAPHVHRELAEATTRALQTDRDRRCSALALRDQLERWLIRHSCKALRACRELMASLYPPPLGYEASATELLRNN